MCTSALISPHDSFSHQANGPLGTFIWKSPSGVFFPEAGYPGDVKDIEVNLAS